MRFLWKLSVCDASVRRNASKYDPIWMKPTVGWKVRIINKVRAKWKQSVEQRDMNKNVYTSFLAIFNKVRAVISLFFLRGYKKIVNGTRTMTSLFKHCYALGVLMFVFTTSIACRLTSQFFFCQFCDDNLLCFRFTKNHINLIKLIWSVYVTCKWWMFSVVIHSWRFSTDFWNGCAQLHGD